jgi:IS5 family transposase
MSNIKLPNSFLARDVYKRLVDQNHFLVKLDEQFDWYELAEPLKDLGENDHGEGGRPRYPAVQMLKMLFVSFLFSLSDRETETEATNHLIVKYFLGLPIDERAPDHTSLCRFREAVLRKKGALFFTNLFRSLLAQAKERGVKFGVVSALDATHTLAKVDTDKQDDPGSPRDPDASWGCKGDETKVTTDGQKVKIPKFFFGYKAHLLGETANNVITGFHVTQGATADIDGGDILIHRVLTNDERKDMKVLIADKGYGCPVWINLLEKYTGIMTAFSLPEWMYKKGSEHLKLKWLNYKQDEGRNAFKRDRYKIEQINGDLKDNHGMRRCRYLGLTKYHLQTAMASMAHNLKIFIKLLTGVRFKSI